MNSSVSLQCGSIVNGFFERLTFNTMTTSKMSPEQLYDLSVAKELSARYKILRLIGNGECGVVYLALDQFEQREVVIKVARLNDAENVDAKPHELWMKEVRLAGQLKHPFIVDTYEAGLIEAGDMLLWNTFLAGV